MPDYMFRKGNCICFHKQYKIGYRGSSGCNPIVTIGQGEDNRESYLKEVMNEVMNEVATNRR